MTTLVFTTLPTVLASFSASFVEFVEALTVVLAIGAVRGWRSALIGSAAALSVLVILVGVFGQSLARVPLPMVQIVVGTLLLMFGLRWLRKAVLRYAGAIALHDEQAAYSRETAALRAAGSMVSRGWDGVAFAGAFKIVMLEGIEVVFIVIAIGSSGRLIVPAAVGAVAACGVVVCLGIWLHRPLENVPENTLKFLVGILLASFGTFWVGEGIDVKWAAADWSLLFLITVYFLEARALVFFCRLKTTPSANRPAKSSAARSKGVLYTLYRESIALFVDDATLAAGIVVWTAMAWWSAARLTVPFLLQCSLFVSGFLLLLAYSALRAVRVPGRTYPEPPTGQGPGI
jgi:uncharacterized membrane protein